jgi:putative SOS response-associated peptidase YedK
MEEGPHQSEAETALRHHAQVERDHGYDRPLGGLAREDGETLRSCTVIRTEANEFMEPLHTRMPVILREKEWSTCLGETPASPPDVKAMLRPYASNDDMRAWPVSERVGSYKNNDADLLAPVEVDQAEFGLGRYDPAPIQAQLD